MTKETTKVMRVYTSDIDKVYFFGKGGDSFADSVRKMIEYAMKQHDLEINNATIANVHSI